MKGFVHSVGGLDLQHISNGEMSLAVERDDTSYYLGWEHKHPYYERILVEERLPNIDDMKSRNKIVNGVKIGAFSPKNTKNQRFFSTLASHHILKDNSEKASFILSGHFPNACGSYAVKRLKKEKAINTFELKLRNGKYFDLYNASTGKKIVIRAV